MPHLNSFRDGWHHLRFMLIWCPKYLFFIPGLILLLGGLAMAAVCRLMGNVVVLRVRLGLSSAMFSSTMMLVGMQVIMFGISAAIVNRRMGWTESDHVSRWFSETFYPGTRARRRPADLLARHPARLGRRGDALRSHRRKSEIDVPLTRMAIIAVFLTLFGLQVVFGTFYLSFLDGGKNAEVTRQLWEAASAGPPTGQACLPNDLVCCATKAPIGGIRIEPDCRFRPFYGLGYGKKQEHVPRTVPQITFTSGDN